MKSKFRPAKLEPGNVVQFEKSIEVTPNSCSSKIFVVDTVDGEILRFTRLGNFPSKSFGVKNFSLTGAVDQWLKSAQIWKSEDDFFLYAGPQLGMYSNLSEIFQVIQVSGKQVKVLAVSKNDPNGNIRVYDFALDFWINTLEDAYKPSPEVKLITSRIEEKTLEVVPFEVICIDSTAFADHLTEGVAYMVTDVFFRKGKKHYEVITDEGSKRGPFADRFVLSGKGGIYAKSDQPHS